MAVNIICNPITAAPGVSGLPENIGEIISTTFVSLELANNQEGI